MDWRDRIVINPAIHHGDPCIKGTRVPLSVIVGSIADGDTFEQVLDVYPHLTADDIRGALRAGRGLTAMTERTVIETSAEVMHGTPVFAGTRVPLKTLFDYLKSGDTLADFLDDFPTVSREQAVKVLELAEEDLIDAAVAGRVAAKEAQSAPRAS